LIKKNKNQLSLYIHWPYCEAKCPYCDFNSHVNEKINVNQWIKSYKNQMYRMKDELIENNVNYKNLSSIFFCGGTPFLMPLEIIENILDISSVLYGFENDIK
jgi:Coproporphyrinogen III oxidase and related Fe-S oxidoreductases